MNPGSSSNSFQPLSETTLSSLSIPDNVTTVLSHKIDNLVEISHIPDGQQINESKLPKINPYKAFKKSFFSIKSLITTERKHVKAYVHSSKLSNCSLRATSEEQYVPMEIPLEFIRQWRQQGYFSLHIGAIRFAITYHGCQGLPVTTRISLLDTRLLNFEHAVIGTLQSTTLNSGTIMVTLFPNYKLSLEDPYLSQALKVQVQLTGVSHQNPAVLHHQMVYRLQDYPYELPRPGISKYPLFIYVDPDEVPTIIYPNQSLSKEQFKALMPRNWTTNYQNYIRQEAPIQSSQPQVVRKTGGSVEVRSEEPK